MSETEPVGPFVLFAGDTYYPGGGAEDYVSTHVTLEDALAALRAVDMAGKHDWAHVMDAATGKQVLDLASMRDV